MEKETDASNKFLVAATGDKLTVMMPPRGPISKDDALNLAAWLVALAGPDDFKSVLDAVSNT